MFEYSVTRKHAMSGVSVLTSVVVAGMHVAVLGGIAVAALAATDVVPVPRSIGAFVAAPAPPPPPPPPPAAAAPRRTPSKVNRSRPPRAPKPAPVDSAPAPAVAPSEIPTEEVDAYAESSAEAESFGVEGGVPGGVVSGIVGGTMPTLPPPPPPPPLAPPKPVRVGGHIIAPRMIHRVAPEYPRVARDGRVQGVVILEATVSAQGHVQSVRVLRANPLLQDAAVRAVKKWRYDPLLLNGTPTPFVLTVTVSFSLN